jgi:hypothetical protein
MTIRSNAKMTFASDTDQRIAVLTDAAFVAQMLALTDEPPKEIASILVNAAKVFGAPDGEQVALSFLKPPTCGGAR